MAWRFSFSSKARREARRLSPTDAAILRRALDRLAEDFGSADVKKLSGAGNSWRLRAGRWRVLLEIDNQTGLITVTRILPRDRAYRD